MQNACKTCSERCDFPLSTLNFLGFFACRLRGEEAKVLLSTSQAFALVCISPERGSSFNSADEVFVRLGGSSGVPGRVAHIDTSGYVRNQLQVSSWPSLEMSFLGLAALRVLRHCSSGTGTVIHTEVADQLMLNHSQWITLSIRVCDMLHLHLLIRQLRVWLEVGFAINYWFSWELPKEHWR